MNFFQNLVLILCFYLTNSENISCRDENGDSVDWFYLYKLPLHFSNIKHTYGTGLNYIYMTSESKTWKLSSKLINQTDSFPGQTIARELTSTSSILIAYNDETPSNIVDFENGHTKGLLVANENSGFWLIHSVPKYPEISMKYDYPKNGLHYGQSFLCISLPSSEINKIGEQLIYNEPNVYESRIPEHLNNLYPNLKDVLNKKWKMNGPFSNAIEINSINGIKFLSFAKGKHFHKELYEDWVAPHLNEDLLVETWRLGPGNLATNCTKRNKVYNVKEISNKEFGIIFNTTSDHSKWAVSINKSWICIGDINRQQHQLLRGGGTMCQLNDEIAKEYHNLIYNFEECNKKY